MSMTLDEIRRQGLLALRERLGRVGMLRFLQQFENGTGDYAQERRKWVDSVTLDDLRKASRKGAPTRKAKKR
jgi:hypothetical protein